MAANPLYTLGQPTPKVESHDKVTGRATHAADFTPANVLWATAERVLGALEAARASR